MKSAEFKIESPDAERLEKVFRDLQYKQQRSIIISALRKATKQTLTQAKANIVHSVTGNLRRSIGLLVMRNEPAVIVGARKRGSFIGHHGHLVEDGTVERSYTTKLGNVHRTGRMKSSASYAGYFRRAVASTEKIAVDIMGEEWYKAIEKYHRKYGLV